MRTCIPFLLALVAPCVSAPIPIFSRGTVDFYDPRLKGGSLLDRSAKAGEPLNVIISGKSSPEVLTPAGFLDYAQAVGMSEECLGLHHGAPQMANLGDGKGWANEERVLREHFSIPLYGTCLESLIGGNHLRVFRQDGPDANSGALFLAVSQEKNIFNEHAIVPNGYDYGRDRFVNAAVGTKTYGSTTYETTVQVLTGLLPPGAKGINHGISLDGIIKLLTVTVKK